MLDSACSITAGNTTPQYRCLRPARTRGPRSLAVEDCQGSILRPDSDVLLCGIKISSSESIRSAAVIQAFVTVENA